MITSLGRFRFPAAGMLLLAALLGGCTPKLDPARYGEVVGEIPHINGMEKPYPLPELESPEDEPDQVEK